jgi:hypothetical protein
MADTDTPSALSCSAVAVGAGGDTTRAGTAAGTGAGDGDDGVRTLALGDSISGAAIVYNANKNVISFAMIVYTEMNTTSSDWFQKRIVGSIVVDYNKNVYFFIKQSTLQNNKARSKPSKVLRMGTVGNDSAAGIAS